MAGTTDGPGAAAGTRAAAATDRTIRSAGCGTDHAVPDRVIDSEREGCACSTTSTSAARRRSCYTMLPAALTDALRRRGDAGRQAAGIEKLAGGTRRRRT